MKKILFTIAIFLIIWGIVILFPNEGEHISVESTVSDPNEYYYNNIEVNEEELLLPEDLNSILNDKQAVPLDTNPSSITVLVNRGHLLPSYYTPDSLVVPNIRFDFSYMHDKRKMQRVAAEAIEKLFSEALKEKYEFYGISGYRSYARQKQIYDNNVSIRGLDATNSVSAMPGSSEHQTGLAMDISIKSINYRLDQVLGVTPEGKWLASNCHKFGFVIRYPKNKNAVTGYTYEPWHIRYVGTTVAAYLYRNHLTLEEYYGSPSGDKYEGVDVEDADKVSYEKPSPTPMDEEKADTTPSPDSSKSKDDENRDNNSKNNEKKPKDTESSKPKKSPRRTPKPANTPKPTKKPVIYPTPSVPTKAPAVTPGPVQESENPTTSGAPGDKQSQQ
ncbi:MAG: D-alanyl-D-alanine carboxypeptidase family protein [Lachnoclostridium sp.]|jgi:LAS superfamily LD-carboxypeptidase LdcB|nr:D-alanyl-D-alanine carboxypeptidase family protein [Lachnoclostridium sp.]